MTGGRFDCRAHVRVAMVGAALVCFAPNAFANGRYPEATQLVVDPGDPNHVLVRATYGLLTTRNKGETWNWICESAIGFSGPEDPPIAITQGGTVLAGLIEGLSVAHGDTCAWAPASPSLYGLPVIDVTARRVGVKSAFAIAWRTTPSATLTELWRSDDDATTWAHVGTDPPADFGAVTVDVAPSDDGRIYMSGGFAPPMAGGGIERSEDGGATWARFDIPGATELVMPYLSAIDPKNADVLYARINGDNADSVVSSNDGGAHWTTIYQAKGALLGFALSPDGSQIAVGGPADGVLLAPSASPTFASVSPLGALCLAWDAAGLYACADEPIAGFTVGLSTDNGHSFAPILHRSALAGPLDCAGSTSVGAACPALWPATQCLLNGTCSNQSGNDVGVTSPNVQTPAGGCACRSALSDAAPSNGLAWLTAIALAALRARKRAPVTETIARRMQQRAPNRTAQSTP